MAARTPTPGRGFESSQPVYRCYRGSANAFLVPQTRTPTTKIRIAATCAARLRLPRNWGRDSNCPWPRIIVCRRVPLRGSTRSYLTPIPWPLAEAIGAMIARRSQLRMPLNCGGDSDRDRARCQPEGRNLPAPQKQTEPQQSRARPATICIVTPRESCLRALLGWGRDLRRCCSCIVALRGSTHTYSTLTP